jgi:hypothetical protein
MRVTTVNRVIKKPCVVAQCRLVFAYETLVRDSHSFCKVNWGSTLFLQLPVQGSTVKVNPRLGALLP